MRLLVLGGTHHVGRAVRAGHYGYVSSRSVYQWPMPAGADESAPVVGGDASSEQADDYATAKRGGELAVLEHFDGPAVLARAGLILGPYELVGRMPWWLRRIERGGDVLAPGPRRRATGRGRRSVGGAGRRLPARPAAAGLLNNGKEPAGVSGRPASVTVDRNDHCPGDGVEAQVEAGHRGGDVGVDPERLGVECVDREHVPVRRVALRGRSAAEVLGAVVIADREGAG